MGFIKFYLFLLGSSLVWVGIGEDGLLIKGVITLWWTLLLYMECCFDLSTSFGLFISLCYCCLVVLDCLVCIRFG